MKAKINLKNKKNDNIAAFVVLSLMCEKLYNHSYISGIFNKEILTLLIILGGYLHFSRHNQISKFDITAILFSFVYLLYGASKESVRYTLVFITIIIWKNFLVSDLSIFHRSIIVLGAMFSYIDYFYGHKRISGFVSGSPTLFAYTILISIIYLLFQKKRKVYDYFCVFLAFILIVKSATSSVLLCALAMVIYKIGVALIRRFRLTQGQIKILITLSGITGIILLVVFLNQALSIISRGNRLASTSTRLDIYCVFIKQLFYNIQMLFIGGGGGYTQYYITNFGPSTSHFPLHQDILMFLCEYGILGVILIYFFYFRKQRFHWLVWILIILGSFHNLILSPVTICIILLTSNSLNRQYNHRKEVWH